MNCARSNSEQNNPHKHTARVKQPATMTPRFSLDTTDSLAFQLYFFDFVRADNPNVAVSGHYARMQSGGLQ